MTKRERHATIRLACLVTALVCLQGCAIAQSPDGSYVVGSRWSGDGVSASGLGTAIGGVASLFMGPGGIAIGTLATGLLGAAGYGVHAAGKSRGEEKGWNDAQTTYSDPPTPAATVVVARRPLAPAPDLPADADAAVVLAEPAAVTTLKTHEGTLQNA